MSSPKSALETKLSSALSSRDKRLIRRRLPDSLPPLSPPPSSSRSTTKSPPSDGSSQKTITTPQTTTTTTNAISQPLIDLTSNDYLSLSTSPRLRELFLKKLHEAPDVLGSGGSRLLVNGRAHAEFEERMKAFFCPAPESSSPSTLPVPIVTPGSGSAVARPRAEDNDTSQSISRSPVSKSPTATTTNNNTRLKIDSALLFNSGFDANVGFFSAIPQPGDAIVYDEYIHASVHDGIRAGRVEERFRVAFGHNDVCDLRRVLEGLSDHNSSERTNGTKNEDEDEGNGFANGTRSIFVSVESLYSMDGTFSPLVAICDMLEELFPRGNAYLVVDEAHSTGVYGPMGRGRVVQLGLERRVLARLHTFGKALAASGAVIITTELIRDYLLNYARSLIYTTSLSYASIIAADASFDLLEDGTSERLSEHLLDLSAYLTNTLARELVRYNIPPSVLSLPAARLPSTRDCTDNTDPDPPSPIIPLHTPHSRALSSHLRLHGINARSITWPTVPRGMDRVRVCLHAGNGRGDVERLVGVIVGWARLEGRGRVGSKL